MQRELYREPQPVVQTESPDQSENLPRIDRWLKQGIENNGGIRDIGVDKLYWDICDYTAGRVGITFPIQMLYPWLHQTLMVLDTHNEAHRDNQEIPTVETILQKLKNHFEDEVNAHLPQDTISVERAQIEGIYFSLDTLLHLFVEPMTLKDEQRTKEYHSLPILFEKAQGASQ